MQRSIILIIMASLSDRTTPEVVSYPMKNARMRMLILCLAGTGLIALVLFLAAGTVRYWQAWVYLAVNGIAAVPYVRYLLDNPRLLEARMKAGPTAEQRSVQKAITLLGFISIVVAFIVPGLDDRFGWSNVPPWLVVTGDLLIVAGVLMVYRVVKENPFGAATVGVVEDQRVVSTGPYGVVRNPMYASALVYLIGMPLALGSYWTLIPSAITVLGLVWRLLDEENFLAQNLPGYTEYCTRVRWHLVPLIF